MQKRGHGFGAGVTLCAAWIGLGGCGDDTSPLAPVDTGTDGTTTTSSTTTTTTSTTTDASGSSSGDATGTQTDTDTDGSSSGTAAGTGTETDGGSSGTSGGAVTCDTVACGEHGSCVVEGSSATCTCDEGYVFEDAQGCIVDQSCIQIRFLEDHCRQEVNGAPAVGLFFGVDFCAGTAVTPDLFDDLDLSFVVLENGEDVAQNVESSATIVETSVENYVAIVLDMSGSVSQSKDLGALIGEVRGLVTDLTPALDEPPVYVSLSIFGRTVREIEPFTADLGTIDAALAAIETDAASFTAQVGANGTQLFTATKEGIENTQRIRDLRAAVTDDGVLTTGTVLVITDGHDTSNGGLDTGLIAGTTNAVLSMGISADIDDDQLTAIGRDGSFITPNPSSWAAAFTEVTQRVEEYPLRSYLLGYCSSATTGSPTVEVSVTGPSVTQVTAASCDFNADGFSSDPFEVCDATFFSTDCDDKGCGGITACGACPDDACCAGSSCVAPMNGNDVGVDCTGQEQVCASDGQVCDTETTACADPAPLGTNGGDPCNPACEPGVGWCDRDEGDNPISCEPTLPLGSLCEFAEQCETLNCYVVNPNNPLEPRTCQPAARLYDHCGATDAECESGGVCGGATCQPRARNLESCGAGPNCRSGTCVDGTCGGPAACYFSWDEKLPG